MQRTNFGDMACSIAGTLDVIGEPWSPMILRDVWVGMNRSTRSRPTLASRARS
jgi:DNA-binding HxlR family transcriptional regulator